MSGTRLLTLRDVEEEYGIPYTSARDLVLRGHLDRVQLGDSRRYWIRREDLEELIERGTDTGALQ